MMYRQQVTYGGFTFPYAKVSITEQTRLSDDGSTPIGTTFQFSISGFLNDDGGGLLNQLLLMRGNLTQPRKDFIIQWNDGTSWISLWSFTGGDDAFGPVPGQLNIKQVSGGRCAFFTWSCEVFKKQCFGSDCSLQNPGNDVLSLSRQWDHAVDEAGYTTRTVSGILRVKKNATTTADSWRYLVIPDVPGWYKRASQTFTQSADGMELTYSIVDQEQHWTLPKPVVKGHAVYSVRFNPLGMMVTHTLSGEFTAGSSASKYDLYSAMVDLLLAKFPNYNGTGSGPQLLFSTIDISESIYENSITFHISGDVAGGGDQDFNSALLRFYVAPPHSDGSAQAPNAYGSTGSGFSSGIIAPRVVPYDACGVNAGPGAPTVPSLPVGTGSVPIPSTSGVPGNPTAAARPNTPSPTPSDSVSTDHAGRPYLEYKETLSYEIDNRIATFSPKKDDSDSKPFIQRTGTPLMTIVQAGYWIRATKDNTPFQIPKPYGYNESGGPQPKFVILSSSISPQNAEPMGASGWFRCTMHWRFVIRANYHLDDYLSGSMYNPTDPRHKTPITPNIGSNVDTNASNQFKIVERLSH